MHAIAEAIAEVLTVCALVLAHPVAVAVGKETALPDVHEVVVVDIALLVVAADAGAGGDGAVDKDGADGDTSLAGVEVVAHLSLIVAEKSLAAVVYLKFALAAGLPNEVENAAELVAPELHDRIGSGSPDREHSEEPPAAHALGDEVRLDVMEFRVVTTVDAGDDIGHKSVHADYPGEGFVYSLETVGMAAHPVVIVAKAVETDGDGVHASLKQGVETGFRKEKAIGDHAPGESLVIDGSAAGLEIVTHKRLATRDDDEHGVGIGAGGNAVEHAEEVGEGHVLTSCNSLTIAATMAAVEVAAQGTLPEQLLQGVVGNHVLLPTSPEFKGDSLAES